MIYDIIGDIHGQADKLTRLLFKLGYHHNGKHFVPPKGHQAIFLGDFIDRGVQQLQTLNTVFAMLDAGVAQAVMGNHEYNALAFATKNNHNPREFLRPHTAQNLSQHQAFLAHVPFNTALHRYWLQRFYELPLWLELDACHVVHACWDTNAIHTLKPLLTDSNRLTPHALQHTGQKYTLPYNALERVLKGVETPLPNGLKMIDKDGYPRSNIRVKWWQANRGEPYIHDIAIAPASGLRQIPLDARSSPVNFQLNVSKPVFVGHYWLQGKPTPLSQQVVGVDYAAAIARGKLTAYRFNSRQPYPLCPSNFIQHV